MAADGGWAERGGLQFTRLAKIARSSSDERFARAYFAVIRWPGRESGPSRVLRRIIPRNPCLIGR